MECFQCTEVLDTMNDELIRTNDFRIKVNLVFVETVLKFGKLLKGNLFPHYVVMAVVAMELFNYGKSTCRITE